MLLAASATLYTSVYVPIVEVSTVPLTVIELDKSPSVSSVAVPGSAHVSPTLSCTVDDPLKLSPVGLYHPKDMFPTRVYLLQLELSLLRNSGSDVMF